MRTPLFEKHLQHMAKMVNFGGWEMPLQYEGILKEHRAVRQFVGLFDVSHMGVIEVTGQDSEKFLDGLSTNAILGCKKDHAIYTVFPNEDGTAVDDLLVYPLLKTKFFLVVNASNREKCLHHLKSQAKGFLVTIKDHFQDIGILSLQGPNALSLISLLFLEGKDLKKMEFKEISYHGHSLILSRTGYTGELGFEIYAPHALIDELFDWFLNEGKAFNLALAGLGARDSLRLEMGYCLYGHELSDEIAVNESVSAWTIHGRDRTFLGKDALLKLENSPKKRYAYGLLLEGHAIPREGFSVFKEGVLIGKVTSGNYSPLLNQPIALFLSAKKLSQGESVEVLVRNHPLIAHIKNLPFIQKNEEKHEIY